MQYTFDTFLKEGKLVDTTTNYKEITEDSFSNNGYVIAYDNLNKDKQYKIKTWDDFCGWLDARAGNVHKKWDPFEDMHFEINKAVDPAHYKKYLDEYQWIEAMARIPTMRDSRVFKGALELQIRKYLDRNGRKDNELQELKKALFYLKYLVLYIEKGIEAKVQDVFNKPGL